MLDRYKQQHQQILSPSPPSFWPSWPTRCVHAVGWICPVLPSSISCHASERASLVWYIPTYSYTCTYIRMASTRRNLTRCRSPLPIVCLACSRSCCFVLSPCRARGLCIVQSRPWMRHTATITLACAACPGNILVNASIPLCYSACKFVKYDSLPRICNCHSSISPASTKKKDKTVALQLISLASSRNPCIFYWDYQVRVWRC